jgi:hypothetical protein
MAPFIIGPIVELGLGLSDGAWHQNAFWIFVLSAMGWLLVWWVVKSGLVTAPVFRHRPHPSLKSRGPR